MPGDKVTHRKPGELRERGSAQNPTNTGIQGEGRTRDIQGGEKKHFQHCEGKAVVCWDICKQAGTRDGKTEQR